MSRQLAVYQQEWAAQVREALPHLSRPQAAVLALFSLGMVFARSCALSAVAAFLAVGLGQPGNTVRQRLRESCGEAEAKAGEQRRAIAVEACFLPLLRWVPGRWEGTVSNGARIPENSGLKFPTWRTLPAITAGRRRGADGGGLDRDSGLAPARGGDR